MSFTEKVLDLLHSCCHDVETCRRSFPHQWQLSKAFSFGPYTPRIFCFNLTFGHFAATAATIAFFYSPNRLGFECKRKHALTFWVIFLCVFVCGNKPPTKAKYLSWYEMEGPVKPKTGKQARCSRSRATCAANGKTGHYDILRPWIKNHGVQMCSKMHTSARSHASLQGPYKGQDAATIYLVYECR